MNQPAVKSRGEVCHRCVQPVPPAATRCPNCGDPIQKSTNVRLILIMLAGLILFVVVSVAIIRLTHRGEAPVDQTEQSESKDTPPPEPQKKPALGQ